MMKTLLIFLFIFLSFQLVNGQTPTDTLFSITYLPSFHNLSRLIVYKDKEGNKGLFKTISVSRGMAKIETASSTLSNETYAAYVRFFANYRFPGYIDNKWPDTTKNYRQGMDGITIIGVYYDNTKRRFRFWSPYDDKESMTLFKMTLNDLSHYFKTKNNKKYLKNLKLYVK